MRNSTSRNLYQGILTCEQNTAEGYSLKHCLQQFKTTNNIIAYQ